MIKDLLNQNRIWAEKCRSDQPEYFDRLAKIQKPEYLWIGCSDSRVPANMITGLQPGEVFVHRNIANIVYVNDINFLSVLEYALKQLKIKHIIICGHYGCGGVRAAVTDKRQGLIDYWLHPIRDLAEQENGMPLEAWLSDEGQNKLCELNVKMQVENILKMPVLRDIRQGDHRVEVHGWIYSLKNGRLHDLNCSYKL